VKRIHVWVGLGALILGALGGCSTSVAEGGAGSGGETSESAGATTGTGSSMGLGGNSSGGSGGSTGSDGGTGPGGLEPPPPGPSHPGDGSGAVFAIKKLYVGDADRSGTVSADAWKLYGYDIDHRFTVCTDDTCQQVTDHCQPLDGGNPDVTFPDGNDGIDNGFGRSILPLLIGIVSTEASSIDNVIASGQWTEIFDLEGLGSGNEYNPLTSRLYTGAALDHVPLVDGSDVWPVRPGSLMNPSDITTSKEIFAGSYVVNNTWVSGLGRLSMPLDGMEIKGFVLDIQHAQITFDMSPDHTSATNGTISGLIPTDELVNELLPAAASYNMSVCNGTLMQSIVEQIRQASDIMKDGSVGTSDQMCDAISIGLGFDAARVKLGGVGAAAPPLKPCP
jgi:hypothetical protein